MLILGLGLTLFFGAHFYSAFRSRVPETELPTRIGPGAYKGAYSLAAAIGLTGIVYGFGATRLAPPLYSAPDGARGAALLLMLPALILIIAAYLPMGHLKKRLHHPMLIGIGLWAASHLLTGANLPKLLLFGLFLLFAVVDFIAAERRPTASDQPPAPNLWMDLSAIVAGVLTYGCVLLWAHRAIVGIDLLPG